MAEWLGDGLQNRVRRFNSAPDLQNICCGIRTMVVHHPSKVGTPVRFWYPAPFLYSNFSFNKMTRTKSIILLLLNIFVLVVALPVVEYDLNKSIKDQLIWLPTNPALDLVLLSIACIIAIYNICLLFFIITRKLHVFELWLKISTAFSLFLVALVVLILGSSFLPIYFPSLFV